MATDSDYQVNPPKRVKQHSWASCWAAAFESVLNANSMSNQMLEIDIANAYSDLAGNGITPDGLALVAHDFGYIFNRFNDDASLFSDAFVMERLQKCGAFLAACKITNPSGSDGIKWGHAQVIWGITYMMNSDIGTGLALLNTMNPATGVYEMYPISYFRNNLPLFTCWRNT
jgi:hypothetical protein